MPTVKAFWTRHDGRVTLTLTADLAAAAWITAAKQSWPQLVAFGASGFEAYARVRFIPDPAYEGQSENEAVLERPAPSETAQLRAVLHVLRHHTGTPEDCYFCVWDGWGWTPEARPGSRISVTDAPKVVVPNRAYFLFRGSLSDLPCGGSAGRSPSGLSVIPDPAFIWPTDHAWCLANDVDPHWAGVGAGRDVVDQLVADPHLDVVRANPRDPQPSYA